MGALNVPVDALTSAVIRAVAGEASAGVGFTVVDEVSADVANARGPDAGAAFSLAADVAGVVAAESMARLEARAADAAFV
jgi:hypothetical protein